MSQDSNTTAPAGRHATLNFTGGRLTIDVNVSGDEVQAGNDNGGHAADRIYGAILTEAGAVMVTLNQLVASSELSYESGHTQHVADKSLQTTGTQVKVRISLEVTNPLKLGYLVAAADILFDAGTGMAIIVADDPQNEKCPGCGEKHGDMTSRLLDAIMGGLDGLRAGRFGR